MSTDKGYVKVYRDVRDHWLWEEKPFDRGRAWIDLLLLVNHEDKKIMFDGALVPVKRGMTITSLHKLADRWGWSTGKVDRFLNLLEQEVMIRQERNTKRTAISIVNYSDYQDSRNTKRNTEKTLTEHSRNTDGTLTELNKKEKNDKNDKERKRNPLNPPLEDEEDDWIDDPGDDPEEAYRKWKEQNGDL